jgi:hypothetical protein
MCKWRKRHSNFQKTEFRLSDGIYCQLLNDWDMTIYCGEMPLTANFQDTEFWRSTVEKMPLISNFQKTWLWRSSVDGISLTAGLQKN